MDVKETIRRADGAKRTVRILAECGRPVDAVDGVNLIGYLRTESGVGAAGRGYARALGALELPVALYDLSSLSGNRAADDTFGGFTDSLPFGVNLVCIDIEPHFAALARLDRALSTDTANPLRFALPCCSAQGALGPGRRA